MLTFKLLKKTTDPGGASKSSFTEWKLQNLCKHQLSSVRLVVPF
jgi:hypothetical protein